MRGRGAGTSPCTGSAWSCAPARAGQLAPPSAVGTPNVSIMSVHAAQTQRPRTARRVPVCSDHATACWPADRRGRGAWRRPGGRKGRGVTARDLPSGGLQSTRGHAVQAPGRDVPKRAVCAFRPFKAVLVTGRSSTTISCQELGTMSGRGSGSGKTVPRPCLGLALFCGPLIPAACHAVIRGRLRRASFYTFSNLKTLRTSSFWPPAGRWPCAPTKPHGW